MLLYLVVYTILYIQANLRNMYKFKLGQEVAVPLSSFPNPDMPNVNTYIVNGLTYVDVTIAAQTGSYEYVVKAANGQTCEVKTSKLMLRPTADKVPEK